MLGVSSCFFLPSGNQVPERRYFLYQQNGFWRRKRVERRFKIRRKENNQESDERTVGGGEL